MTYEGQVYTLRRYEAKLTVMNDPKTFDINDADLWGREAHVQYPHYFYASTRNRPQLSIPMFLAVKNYLKTDYYWYLTSQNIDNWTIK